MYLLSDKTTILKYILQFLLILLLFFTLSGGLNYYIPRSIKELWDLGHIFLFYLFSIYLIKYYKWYSGKTTLNQVIILFFIVALISVLIEGLQKILERGTPDFYDIRRNYCGAALGYIILKKEKYNLWGKIFRFSIIIWFFLELFPFSLSLADEIAAYKQFPKLADFETNLELSRWSGSAIFERTNQYGASGNNSLKINLNTNKYSGVSLNHFPGNWSNYRFFVFNIFYPDNDSLRIICRINDDKHLERGQRYNDRYNQSMIITHGWNKLFVPLEKVKNAPYGRVMNMKKIMNISFFTVRLSKNKIIYLDNLYLE